MFVASLADFSDKQFGWQDKIVNKKINGVVKFLSKLINFYSPANLPISFCSSFRFGEFKLIFNVEKLWDNRVKNQIRDGKMKSAIERHFTLRELWCLVLWLLCLSLYRLKASNGPEAQELSDFLNVSALLSFRRKLNLVQYKSD